MGLRDRLRRRHGPRWAQRWAVYPGEIEGHLAIYFVDLGAAAAAPVAGLPVRLDVTVRFAARPDGMPADGHLPSVQRLEDVVSAIAEAERGTFIGRVISAGACRYTAYLPTEPVRPVVLPRDDFDPVLSIERDPVWTYVRGALAPDERQRHVIGDLGVVQALVQHGDPLDPERPVDHTGLFADLARAEAAASELRMDGFTAKVWPDRDGGFVLEAIRVDSVAPPVLHELTWAVCEVVRRHGGVYDGWSCEVVR